uniref:Uncharacterized protein n=1 Tax=Setaria italica TaxID=4555 RepID=K3ZPU3_SETIT
MSHSVTESELVRLQKLTGHIGTPAELCCLFACLLILISPFST